MSVFDSLLAAAGAWQGKSTLQDPNTGQPEESTSTLTITPVLQSRFVRLDYTWTYQGNPQAGSLLIGLNRRTGTASVIWIDTWHMGDQIMACRGLPAAPAALSVRGAYPAPPGPDWGWRIDIASEASGEIRLRMYNIWPEVQREDLAVDATYKRA